VITLVFGERRKHTEDHGCRGNYAGNLFFAPVPAEATAADWSKHVQRLCHFRAVAANEILLSCRSHKSGDQTDGGTRQFEHFFGCFEDVRSVTNSRSWHTWDFVFRETFH